MLRIGIVGAVLGQHRIVLALAFWIGLCLGTASADPSDGLSLAGARAALSDAGGMVGKVFAVGVNRYVVRSSHVVSRPRANVFLIEIEALPLEKHIQ